MVGRNAQSYLSNYLHDAFLISLTHLFEQLSAAYEIKNATYRCFQSISGDDEQLRRRRDLEEDHARLSEAGIRLEFFRSDKCSLPAPRLQTSSASCRNSGLRSYLHLGQFRAIRSHAKNAG